MIEDFAHENGLDIGDSIDGWSHEQMEAYIAEHNIPCPTCGKHNFTEIREFNLMFKTFQGVTEDAKNVVYLRPETAQGIFVNFKFSCTERKVTRRDLISERFTDLANTKRKFLS